MDKSKKAEKAGEIAKASIEAVRSLAQEKKEMNIENLSKEFLKHDSLFDISVSGENVLPSAAFTELQEKYNKLEDQKNSFFRDYEELNYKKEKERKFYSKALLFFSDFSKSSVNDDAKNALDKFRKRLKNDSGIDILESELSDLRNIMIKAELEAAEKQEEKKKFLKKLRFAHALSSDKEQQNEYIIILKETYKEIIEKLYLSVDESTVKVLAEIALEIEKISSPDDFFILRSKLLDILNSYLKTVDDDREEAAKFIKEVGERLLDVESRILDSYLKDSDHYKQSNLNFTSIIENYLNDLNKNVSISKTLDEVKSAVVSKLNTLKIVINRKNAEDKVYHEKMNSKLKQMEESLIFLKQELGNATIRAKKMEKDLLFDPLTGAYNRRAYDKKVKEEIERFFRYKTGFSMILFDIDHFKNINDTYGHDIGDRCLFEIIKEVSPLLRKSDFLARYGGEEFIVILPETALEGAGNVAEKIRQSIEELSFVYKKEEIKITISLGVCEIGEKDSGYQSLFSRLDKAMYKAKKSGRNRVVVGK